MINLRASVLPSNGMKLNSEAPSSWKLTVDAVQVIASREAQALEHQEPFSQGGGWQFEPSGRFASSLVDGHSLLLSVQYPELPTQGSLLTLRMKVQRNVTTTSSHFLSAGLLLPHGIECLPRSIFSALPSHPLASQ